MDVEEVINLGLDEVANVFVDADAIGGHLQGAELDLRLTLKHRLLDINGNGCNNTCADVAILIFAEEFLDGLGDVLLEGTLMSTALGGVLAIHERVILLAVLVGMGKGDLDILTLEMDDRIEAVVGHPVVEQILQSVTGEDATTIIHDGQACIQIGIVAEHILHDIILEAIVQEKRIVGLEEDVGAVLVLCGFRIVARDDTLLEGGLTHFSLAEAAHLKMGTQRIDSLHTDTVQTHRLLESLRVILTASVQDADGLNHLTLGDATPIVAYRHSQIVFDINLKAVAGLHLKLIDGVVDDFFQ